jgi:CheY-like chemotaxis protein
MDAAFRPILRGVFPVPVTRPTILCVDDYETSLAGWCLYLQNEGYSVTTARTAQEGLERFAVTPVDLVLLDYLMPESNGDDVAATMKQIKPDVRILMFSGVPHVPEMRGSTLMPFCKKDNRLPSFWIKFASCSNRPAKWLEAQSALWIGHRDHLRNWIERGAASEI